MHGVFVHLVSSLTVIEHENKRNVLTGPSGLPYAGAQTVTVKRLPVSSQSQVWEEADVRELPGRAERSPELRAARRPS